MKAQLQNWRSVLAGHASRRWWKGLTAFGPVQGWRERLYAARHCRRLREQFVATRALHPALRGEALYVEVVRRELGVDADRARQIVGLAAESFATWPMARAVNFRDVVHYLVFLKLSERDGWVGGAVGRAINCRVPSDW